MPVSSTSALSIPGPGDGTRFDGALLTFFANPRHMAFGVDLGLVVRGRGRSSGPGAALFLRCTVNPKSGKCGVDLGHLVAGQGDGIGLCRAIRLFSLLGLMCTGFCDLGCGAAVAFDLPLPSRQLLRGLGLVFLPLVLGEAADILEHKTIVGEVAAAIAALLDRRVPGVKTGR